MQTVQNFGELRDNLRYFYEAGAESDRRQQPFVDKGMCFVVFDTSKGVGFAPSRFVGYKDNSFRAHGSNEGKDGRETNPAITKIVGFEPSVDEDVNELYVSYCEEIGFTASELANFGKDRKFWDLRVVR